MLVLLQAARPIVNVDAGSDWGTASDWLIVALTAALVVATILATRRTSQALGIARKANEISEAATAEAKRANDAARQANEISREGVEAARQGAVLHARSVLGAQLVLESLGSQRDGIGTPGEVIAQSWIVRNIGRGNAWPLLAELILPDGPTITARPSPYMIASAETRAPRARDDFKFVVPVEGFPESTGGRGPRSRRFLPTPLSA